MAPITTGLCPPRADRFAVGSVMAMLFETVSRELHAQLKDIFAALSGSIKLIDVINPQALFEHIQKTDQSRKLAAEVHLNRDLLIWQRRRRRTAGQPCRQR